MNGKETSILGFTIFFCGSPILGTFIQGNIGAITGVGGFEVVPTAGAIHVEWVRRSSIGFNCTDIRFNVETISGFPKGFFIYHNDTTQIIFQGRSLEVLEIERCSIGPDPIEGVDELS